METLFSEYSRALSISQPAAVPLMPATKREKVDSIAVIQVQLGIRLQGRRQLPGAAAEEVDVLSLGLDLAVLLRRIGQAAAARVVLRMGGEIATGGAGKVRVKPAPARLPRL